MKDQNISGNPNISKTSSLKGGRVTGSLEQLPPTKKRDLRTGSLNPADTQPSINIADSTEKSAAPEPPPQPAQKPAPQPVQQPAPQQVQQPAQSAPVQKSEPSGQQTSAIEAQKITNH